MSAHAIWIGRRDQPREGRVVELAEGEALRVGRGDGCDVVLNDRVVSSQHLELRRLDGALRVRDLSSLNGTFLQDGDGAQGADGRRLEPGEVIVLDDRQSLRVGPFLLFLCERASDDVSLGRVPLFDIVTDPDHRVDGADRSSQVEPDFDASGEALRGLSARLRESRAPEALLASLVERSGAKTGHLFSLEGTRFILAASEGVDGSPCVSQSFLSSTAARERTWSIRPGHDGEIDASKSLLAFPESTLLLGVPVRGRDGVPIAVAHLEADACEVDASCARELDALAEVGGVVLELAFATERAQRGRDAAERRADAARGRPSRGDRGSARPTLIGAAPAFLDAVSAVERAAPTSSTLLLRGDSGTGKDELARLAHAASERAQGPFVALNCASIASELVESELFGADKGAFTGAHEARTGAIERAHGGTLFLDEIGELSAAAQASLLRVLETGELVRVGGSVRMVDVRLVAATHRDLEAMIDAGTFRRDLYYRLRVIEVWLPALAERSADVVPLAEHFLAAFLRPDGERVSGITGAAAMALGRYAWPGNVRELRNVIERAVVVDDDGVLDIDDLPAEIRASDGDRDASGLGALLDVPWQEAKKRFEERYFRRALELEEGAVQKAADRAGVTRRLLTMKIRDLRLRAVDESEPRD